MNTMGFLFRREPSPADEKQKIPANGTVSAKEGQSLSLTAAGCDTVRSRFPVPYPGIGTSAQKARLWKAL